MTKGTTRRLAASALHRADAVLFPTLIGVTTSDPVVALTFDDGPDADTTLLLASQLGKRGHMCTFFFLSQRATLVANVARRVVALDHEVALHGPDHSPIAGWRFLRVIIRLSAARSTLRRAASSPVRYFRPPYGWQSRRSYLATRACGLLPVLWAVDAHDYLSLETQEVAERVFENLHAGDIVLLHERYEEPVSPVPPTLAGAETALWPPNPVELAALIMAGLDARGLRSVTISELISRGTPRRIRWIHNPRQPSPQGPA
ncbi:MAG: polysaccharide deacetylase family protein [Acidimicrobiales bacterium]